MLTPEPAQALARLQAQPSYGELDLVKEVTAPSSYESETERPRYHVVALDCGLKLNILRLLQQRGCRVPTVPASTPARDILALRPHGIVLSPGPGDPALLGYIV